MIDAIKHTCLSTCDSEEKQCIMKYRIFTSILLQHRFLLVALTSEIEGTDVGLRGLEVIEEVERR